MNVIRKRPFHSSQLYNIDPSRTSFKNVAVLEGHLPKSRHRMLLEFPDVHAAIYCAVLAEPMLKPVLEISFVHLC